MRTAAGTGNRVRIRQDCTPIPKCNPVWYTFILCWPWSTLYWIHWCPIGSIHNILLLLFRWGIRQPICVFGLTVLGRDPQLLMTIAAWSDFVLLGYKFSGEGKWWRKKRRERRRTLPRLIKMPCWEWPLFFAWFIKVTNYITSKYIQWCLHFMKSNVVEFMRLYRK